MPLTRIKPQGLVDEGVSYIATPATWTTGVNAYDFRNGPTFYHTLNNPTASWTANITNVPTTYASNQSIVPSYGGMIVEVKIMAQIGATAYYPNAIQIDGVPVAATYQGTTATINKLNIWTIQLIRVGTTWTKVLVKTVEAY